MDWIITYSDPDIDTSQAPGHINDPGEPGALIDPRRVYSLLLEHDKAYFSPPAEYHPEYWIVRAQLDVGVTVNLTAAFTTVTPAQSAYEDLLAIVQTAADARDTASSGGGSASFTFTVPETIVTGESTPS